jgi:signal recognition particle subunit SRP19
MAYDADVAITLWPEYFDLDRTRAEGRRLPKELCVRNPDLDIIAKGAMILDLEYEILEDKAYPKTHRRSNGCVKVERGVYQKTELLVKIGQILVSNKA